MTAAAHTTRLDAIAEEFGFAPPPPALDRTDRVLLLACASLGRVDVSDLANSASQVATHARHLFCLTARQQLRRTWQRIADLLDRDPSTVRASVESAEARAFRDPDFAAAYDLLAERFDGLGQLEFSR